MASYNNGNSYSYGDSGPSFGASSYGGYGVASPSNSSTLRRRSVESNNTHVLRSQSSSGSFSSPPTSTHGVVKRLDLFPKVDHEYTVQTDGGGTLSLIAMIVVAILLMAETYTWISQNRATVEHISVDTSLGKRMRVNINITFPQLACVDLHLDAMDVAGDSQLDIEDTLVKRHLHTDMTPLSNEEIKVETNKHQQELEKKEALLKEKLPPNYCGPCFGAHETDGQCCQTCDELLDAYKKKMWKYEMLIYTAEQCIREGRDKQEPKRMSKGMGCNLSGYMTVNRVAGNFHIAMGEGTERDGRHIHSFVPEDAPNFNASHIIHELSFGPGEESSPLNGVTKIVGPEHGTTGLFQYFIKVVPTSYKGMTPPVSDQALPSLYEEVENHPDGFLETNRYYYTERFRPLLKEIPEEAQEGGEGGLDENGVAQAAAGGAHHSHQHKHAAQAAILPGVFFMYEIYPFSVEISPNQIPFSHLLIRLLATVGGVFTIVKALDGIVYARDKKRGRLVH